MKVLIFALNLLFVGSLFAEGEMPKDQTHVNVIGYFQFSSQFATPKLTQMDYDLFGVRIQRDFGDNLSAVIFPAFTRFAAFVDPSKITNNALVFIVYEAYFNVKDIGYGVGLTIGQVTSPWNIHERYYYDYQYIAHPLSFKLFFPTVSFLGAFLSKNFLDNAVRTSFAVTSGEEWLNNEKDGVQAYNAMVAFFPFLKSGDALKDFSVAANVRALSRTSQQSIYNFLVGYKYRQMFSASFEYLSTYSSVRNNKTTGASLNLSYTFLNPAAVLFRYDYTDNYVGGRSMQNFIMGGLAYRFFDSRLQTAITFDVTKPTTGEMTSKRLLVSTYVAI